MRKSPSSNPCLGTDVQSVGLGEVSAPHHSLFPSEWSDESWGCPAAPATLHPPLSRCASCRHSPCLLGAPASQSHKWLTHAVVTKGHLRQCDFASHLHRPRGCRRSFVPRAPRRRRVWPRKRPPSTVRGPSRIQGCPHANLHGMKPAARESLSWDPLPSSLGALLPEFAKVLEPRCRWTGRPALQSRCPCLLARFFHFF